MHVVFPESQIIAPRRVTGSWLDTRSRPINYLIMCRFSSILLLAFLAVIAASTVVHAVSANAMTLEMAVTDGSVMAMEDCQGCPTGGEGAADLKSCQLDCTATSVVTLPAASSFIYLMPVLRQGRPMSETMPNSLREPPDPFPPRYLIRSDVHGR